MISLPSLSVTPCCRRLLFQPLSPPPPTQISLPSSFIRLLNCPKKMKPVHGFLKEEIQVSIIDFWWWWRNWFLHLLFNNQHNLWFFIYCWYCFFLIPLSHCSFDSLYHCNNFNTHTDLILMTIGYSFNLPNNSLG